MSINDRLLQIVEEEIARSIEKHGRLNSRHEAYAVMLEELEEAGRDLYTLEDAMDRFWDHTKHNWHEYVDKTPACICNSALNAAAELIQVAAMAEKFKRQEEGK